VLARHDPRSSRVSGGQICALPQIIAAGNVAGETGRIAPDLIPPPAGPENRAVPRSAQAA
jgi:hypothetical protein